MVGALSIPFACHTPQAAKQRGTACTVKGEVQNLFHGCIVHGICNSTTECELY